MKPKEQSFIEAFKDLSGQAYTTAKSKGWWRDRNDLVDAAGRLDIVRTARGAELEAFAKKTVFAMNIALMHSELSEALEASRNGAMDDKIPEFKGEETELADVIIRIMDTSEACGLRVAEAVVAKMAMNQGREYKHGGKAF